MFFQNTKTKAKNPVFKTGDTITVCSKKEIKQTLESSNTHENCLFMEQMWEYCDQEFTIKKIVNHLFDEKRCKIHKSSLPLYILEGVICNGDVESFENQCDHSCYLLWHQDWLRKV